MMTYLTLIALFIPVSVKTYQYYIIQEAKKSNFIEKSKAYNRKIEYDFSKLEIPEFEQLKELFVNGERCPEVDTGKKDISLNRKFDCQYLRNELFIFGYEDRANVCEKAFGLNDASCYVRADKSVNASIEDLSMYDSLSTTNAKIELIETDIIGRLPNLLLTYSYVGKNFLIACFYNPENEIYSEYPKDCQIFFNKKYKLRLIPKDNRVFPTKEREKFINLYEVIRDLKIDYK